MSKSSSYLKNIMKKQTNTQKQKQNHSLSSIPNYSMWPWINYLTSLSTISYQTCLEWFWDINEMKHVNSWQSAMKWQLSAYLVPTTKKLQAFRSTPCTRTGHQRKEAALPLHLWERHDELHGKQKWVKKSQVQGAPIVHAPILEHWR